MTWLLCLLIGVLTAASVWLMLSRNLVKFLFGLVLVSNVANLVIIVGGGFTQLAPALIGDSTATLSNALPQALVLTAIVIGFGLVAFVLVLAVGTYRVFDTVDMDAIRFAEPVEQPGIIDAERTRVDGVDIDPDEVVPGGVADGRASNNVSGGAA